jgi:hypothetical protein
MGHGIFAENGALVFQGSGKGFVNRSIAERSSPSSGGNYGGGFAARKMADAENQDFWGQRDARKNGSDDVP